MARGCLAADGGEVITDWKFTAENAEYAENKGKKNKLKIKDPILSSNYRTTRMGRPLHAERYFLDHISNIKVANPIASATTFMAFEVHHFLLASQFFLRSYSDQSRSHRVEPLLQPASAWLISSPVIPLTSSLVSILILLSIALPDGTGESR